MMDASETPLPEADVNLIQRIIPHRYPFLFIDRVRDIRVGESCVGVKNVTFNEPHFQGHFPGKPVMPGVTVVEAMAQTAAVLVGWTLDMVDKDLLVYFMTLDNTRFRRQVVPGDVLELHVKIIKARSRIFKFQGVALANGERAAEAEFSAMMVLPGDNK